MHFEVRCFSIALVNQFQNFDGFMYLSLSKCQPPQIFNELFAKFDAFRCSISLKDTADRYLLPLKLATLNHYLAIPSRRTVIYLILLKYLPVLLCQKLPIALNQLSTNYLRFPVILRPMLHRDSYLQILNAIANFLQPICKQNLLGDRLSST